MLKQKIGRFCWRKCSCIKYKNIQRTWPVTLAPTDVFFFSIRWQSFSNVTTWKFGFLFMFCPPTLSPSFSFSYTQFYWLFWFQFQTKVKGRNCYINNVIVENVVPGSFLTSENMTNVNANVITWMVLLLRNIFVLKKQTFIMAYSVYS